MDTDYYAALGSLVPDNSVPAEQIPITPDPLINLEADDVEEAITELATELNEIDEMQDLTTLFLNSLV